MNEQSNIIFIEQELTFESVNRDYKKILSSINKVDATDITINLSRVAHIDSAGIALLIQLVRDLQKKNYNFSFVDIPEKMRGLIGFFKLSEVFALN